MMRPEARWESIYVSRLMLVARGLPAAKACTLPPANTVFAGYTLCIWRNPASRRSDGHRLGGCSATAADAGLANSLTWPQEQVQAVFRPDLFSMKARIAA